MSYQANIPTGTVNLSADYLNLQTNFTALNNVFFINHFKFSDSTGNLGKHRFIEQPSLGNQVTNFASPNTFTLPTPLAAGEGTLFTNTTTGTISPSLVDLYYTQGTIGNGYQLTNTDDTNFATFGTQTNYPPMVDNQYGGWTFLPGGLILQYGQMQTTGATTPVVYPKPFLDTTWGGAYSISVNLRIASGANVSYGYNGNTLTGFNFISNTSGATFVWSAIGR